MRYNNGACLINSANATIMMHLMHTTMMTVKTMSLSRGVALGVGKMTEKKTTKTC
jgi:hypothetical protein